MCVCVRVWCVCVEWPREDHTYDNVMIPCPVYCQRTGGGGGGGGGEVGWERWKDLIPSFWTLESSGCTI